MTISKFSQIAAFLAFHIASNVSIAGIQIEAASVELSARSTVLELPIGGNNSSGSVSIEDKSDHGANVQGSVGAILDGSSMAIPATATTQIAGLLSYDDDNSPTIFTYQANIFTERTGDPSVIYHGATTQPTILVTIEFTVSDQGEPGPVFTELTNDYVETVDESNILNYYVRNKDTNTLYCDGPIQPCLLPPGRYEAYVALLYLYLGGTPIAPVGTTNWDYTFSWTFNNSVLITYEPGFLQSNPILPPDVGEPCCSFDEPNVRIGRWWDPPIVSGYRFEAQNGTLFTDIMNFPSGFDDEFSVFINDIEIGKFGPGETVNFEEYNNGLGISAFVIRGISPLTELDDPQAFPIQLAFSADEVSFTMTPISDFNVPLPIYWLVVLALSLLGTLLLRKPKK